MQINYCELGIIITENRIRPSFHPLELQTAETSPAMATVPAFFGQAVRAATHRALEARERVAAGCPQWEDWRGQVRAAKADMVDHYQEYAAQLQEAVESWGGIVYWAKDAVEARELILKVARRHRVARVVQSKSMTAHEIGLEPFLSSQGIRLSETDLGEFIIQLAGHAPSHLTAPALHLDRRQIAHILSEAFNCEAPTDPVALTRLAARQIAPRYAEADMGITGVNFAAVRDGTLVCLENEGNLRLSATLPPVHLALMGWEKMVPELSLLSPFLRLLPASATGQTLTSLVHFWRGLKTGPQGDQAFYLVIVDNGRSRLAAHPELREALYCLRCGACLNICPVFQAGGAHLYNRVYPGAIGALLAPFLPPPGDISDLCTQCGACREVCPAAIELPPKIRYLRQKAPSFRRARALTGAVGFILGQPRLYRTLESPALFLGQTLLRSQAQKIFPGKLPEESFFRKYRRNQGEKISRSSNTPPFQDIPPNAAPKADNCRLEPPGDLAGRLAEVGAVLVNLEGVQALARYLKDTTQGEVWLEDHPWLGPVARELADLGTPSRLVRDEWAPPADTAVTVGLGAIPETGSVVTAGGRGPAGWLPFWARRHVVLVPPGQASLDIEEALTLTSRSEESPVTWLTGPTRTADIEKILVLGAQGPAEMAVVLYQPPPPGE
jgi:L-lactate dehydrogenase complex protein LldF